MDLKRIILMGKQANNALCNREPRDLYKLSIRPSVPVMKYWLRRTGYVTRTGKNAYDCRWEDLHKYDPLEKRQRILGKYIMVDRLQDGT